MSRKTKIYKDSENCNYQFTNWMNVMVNLISPKNMFAVLGRGTGKTTDILSDRLVNVCHDMPRAKAFFATDTYVHAISDMIPALLRGLEIKGYRNEVDFITDVKPPSNWEGPLTRIMKYKHTISFRNGFFLKIVSMDEPSSMAGDSYQHGFGDEIKYIDFNVIKKIFPALRGDYLDFHTSPYYGGLSFTTDMPNITDSREFDWILDRENQMNKDQIKLILATAQTLNEIKIEYIKAYDKQNAQKMKVLEKRVAKWESRLNKIRRNSTLFIKGSSFINPLLDVNYFKDSLNSLGEEGMKTSVFSMEPELEDGEKFYINLGDHHFISDGVKNEFYKDYKLTDTILPTSEALKYIDRNKEIEAGVDFGNMCSMVTGQTKGSYIYVLKEFYTLAPDHVKELAEKFRSFYRNHPNKKLRLFYDRSGNQNKNIQKDFASELKRHIEYDEHGYSTGWKVTLESKGQKTIFQDEEYSFMATTMGETQPKLPKIKIDKFQCKCLRSSLGLTKIKMGKNRKGQTIIQKNKNSEKLPLTKLPEYSTNFSDAFKYFMMRKHWIKIAGGKIQHNWSSPTAH